MCRPAVSDEPFIVNEPLIVPDLLIVCVVGVSEPSISVRNPYELEKGTVTYAMLQSIFPFDNTLVLCSVKGRDLQSKFFETQNSNYFIYYEQYGEDVRTNLDPNATYYIIVDSYSSSYAPNRLTVIEEYDVGVYARDLLAAFIENGGLAS